MKSPFSYTYQTIKAAACCALIVVIANANAIAAPSSGDQYGGASPGATAITNAKDIMNKDRANLACNGSLCTIFSVSVNKTSFNVTTYVGNGAMPMQQNSGSTNYYYGTSGMTGTNTAGGGLGYGIELSWDKTNCTKNVNVDKSVYDSVTTYMKALIDTTPGDPNIVPEFYPSEQTMILFYTTIMDLTKGSTCN